VPLVVLAAFQAVVLGERILFIKEYLALIEQRFVHDKSKLPGYESYFSEGTKSQ
jgi:hypothetical protein